MGRVILVLCDALRDDTARERMGFLEHLVEVRQASRYTVLAELPTLSRPCYEAIHTGTPATEHGVWHNKVVRRSKMPNLFGLARAAGHATAASAYYWVSELYNRAPFDPIEDREVDDTEQPIQHGRFYSEDSYPDSEVLIAAAALARRFQPGYLLVHPMGLDFRGEEFGSDSAEYRNWATRQDALLAGLVPEWLGAGYTVLVTGDHGMNSDGSHGGTTPDVRQVPLYVITSRQSGLGDTDSQISQLQLAPTICTLMAMPIPISMGQPVIRGLEAEL